jgi:hypothetical protein
MLNEHARLSLIHELPIPHHLMQALDRPRADDRAAVRLTCQQASNLSDFAAKITA